MRVAGVPPEFAQQMVELAAAYPTARLTELQVRTYFTLLQDIPLPALRVAAARAASELTFFPSVAELRRYIVPSPDDAAVLAWTGLLSAAERIGAYASLHVADPYTAVALLQVFGAWPAFCAQCVEGPALNTRRQEFMAAYREARRTPGVQPQRLAGLCEQEGRYAGGARVWVGLLSAGGAVTSERDVPQLQGGAGARMLGEAVGGE